MTFPLLALLFLMVSAASLGGAVLTRRYALFGMAGSTLLLALHGRVFLEDTSADDAFIYFRYARNWADGFGPNWNYDGERVEGYTGILWLLPLVAAAKLGLDIPATARYLGFACSVGVLAMQYPLAARLPEGRLTPLAPVLAGLALAASAPFAAWTFAGMEAPLFMLLVLVAVYFHLREDASQRGIPWSGLFFALAMATRPEGALFAAVTGLFKLSALRDPQSRRDRLFQLWAWLGFIVLLYGSYFLWRYQYYGHLLPNTFYAKASGGSDYYDRGVHYLADSGSDYGLLLLFAGFVAYLARISTLRPVLYVAALSIAWVAWVALSGGDTLIQGRFIVPVLPLLFLPAAFGALLMLRTSGEQFSYAVARPAFALLFAAVLMGFLYHSLHPFVEFNRNLHGQRVTIGRWMAKNLPPDTTIAVTAAGAIPYYSKLPTLDMLGLNDEHIAHVDTSTFDQGASAVIRGFAGHEKYDVDYVLAQRPQVIFLGGGVGFAPRPTQADYARANWDLPNEYYLVHHPRTFQLYAPVVIAMGEGGWLNLLVDRQARTLHVRLRGLSPP